MTRTIETRLKALERKEDSGLKVFFCKPEDFEPGPGRIRFDEEDKNL